MADSNYSEYKIIAWRFGRTFLSTFLILFGSGLSEVNNVGMLRTLLVSAGSGAIVALGKSIRVMVKENKVNIYNSIIKKLPI